MRAPEFWKTRGPLARILSTALTPLGWAYGASVAFKAARAKPYRAAAKVICVGNLTVGGSGKTPVVRAVADALRARGLHVCVLSRGYGGRLRGPVLVDPALHSANDVGDEPLMLAAEVPVVISRDRAAGARLAEMQDADVILMDDGHQNFSVTKDLSLVVVDSSEGFGNGRVVPAGPLREPVRQGLARADAVIPMGDGAISFPRFGGPVLCARLTAEERPGLSTRRLIAFAGIGRPDKFFETLKAISASVVEAHSFPDHHVYRSSELDRLRERALRENALLVTTEKDFSRLSDLQRNGIAFVRVRARFEHPERLSKLLDNIVPNTPIAAVS